MDNTNNKLLNGSLWKSILSFSIPIIFTNLLQVLFNMSDIAVIGKFSGDISLGAVGSTATLVTLFTGFLIGISNAVNVIVARHIGEKNELNVKKAVHTSFLVCLFTGLILAILGICFAYPLLKILRTKDAFISGATLYLCIYFLGMPCLSIYNFGNAVYSANGQTKKPLFFLAIAGVINVLLNLLFVIEFNMDVVGVAVASVISQSLSAIMVIVSLAKAKDAIRFKFKDLKLDKRSAKAIISLGIPSGFQNCIFAVANLFIQSGVNSLSEVAVEGNAAASNADGLIYDSMAAFYMACSSFISQNLGAGKNSRAIKTYKICLIYSTSLAIIISAILGLFGKEFLLLFTSEDAVVEAGMERLSIMCFSFPVSAFMDCTIAASRGYRKSVIPTIIVILGSCVFRVIWVYTVFAYYQTILSLYSLYIFSWTITSITEIIYFILIARKENRRRKEEIAIS